MLPLYLRVPIASTQVKTGLKIPKSTPKNHPSLLQLFSLPPQLFDTPVPQKRLINPSLARLLPFSFSSALNYLPTLFTRLAKNPPHSFRLPLKPTHNAQKSNSSSLFNLNHLHNGVNPLLFRSRALFSTQTPKTSRGAKITKPALIQDVIETTPGVPATVAETVPETTLDLPQKLTPDEFRAALFRTWRIGFISAVHFVAFFSFMIFIGIKLKAGYLFYQIAGSETVFDKFIESNELKERYPKAWGLTRPSEAQVTDDEMMTVMALKNFLIYHELLLLLPDSLKQCQKLISTATPSNYPHLKDHQPLHDLLISIKSELESHIELVQLPRFTHFGAFLQFLAYPESPERPLLMTRWWKRWGTGAMLMSTNQQLNGSIMGLKMILQNLELVTHIVNSLNDENWCKIYCDKMGISREKKDEIEMTSKIPNKSIDFNDILGLSNYLSLITFKPTMKIINNYTHDKEHDIVEQLKATKTPQKKVILSPPVNFQKGLHGSYTPGLNLLKHTKVNELLRLRSCSLSDEEIDYFKTVSVGKHFDKCHTRDEFDGYISNDNIEEGNKNTHNSSHSQDFTSSPYLFDLNLLPNDLIGPQNTSSLFQPSQFAKHNYYFSRRFFRVDFFPVFWTYTFPTHYDVPSIPTTVPIDTLIRKAGYQVTPTADNTSSVLSPPPAQPVDLELQKNLLSRYNTAMTLYKYSLNENKSHLNF
jgi:hypothetical protein